MGQFARLREYPNASFTAVTAPNADTLYTTAWLDVSKKPWILSIPDMKGRYFLFPMLDSWTNVMRFDTGQLPPVEGFWSLTMYNAQYFFVDNPLNRYTLSQRDKFKVNVDGSIDLYIQNESSGKDKESNWLPAPKGAFILMVRMCWPKEKSPSILDGIWKIPEVKEASQTGCL